MAEWLGYKVAAHPAVVAEWLALQFSKTSILLGPRFETRSGLHDAINSAHNGGTKCSVFFLNGAYASMKWTIKSFLIKERQLHLCVVPGHYPIQAQSQSKRV